MNKPKRTPANIAFTAISSEELLKEAERTKMITQEQAKGALEYLDSMPTPSTDGKCSEPPYRALDTIRKILTLYSEGKIKEVLSDEELRELLPKKEWCECIGNCQHEKDSQGFNRAIDLCFTALQGKIKR